MPAFSTEPDSVVRAMFYGLGADGTVGANKNSIKIIGENTDNYAQGYFVYDSKKSGAMTVSHLRFGPQPIQFELPGLQSEFRRLPSVDLPRALRHAQHAGATAAYSCLTVRSAKTKCGITCRAKCSSNSSPKKRSFYMIDAYQVARDTGMGSRMNTIMQVCFFAISKVLPRDEAIEAIRESIRHTYGRRAKKSSRKTCGGR